MRVAHGLLASLLIRCFAASDEVAKTIFIYSDNVSHVTGAYDHVEDSGARSPMWRRRDSDEFLFSNTNSTWVVSRASDPSQLEHSEVLLQCRMRHTPRNESKLPYTQSCSWGWYRDKEDSDMFSKQDPPTDKSQRASNESRSTWVEDTTFAIAVLPDPWIVMLPLVWLFALWFYIARGSYMTSAWGAPNALDDPEDQKLPKAISVNMADQLEGRPAVLTTFLTCAGYALWSLIGSFGIERIGQCLVAFCANWGVGVGITMLAWKRLGSPVRLGLLATFFLTGGCLGIIFSIVFEGIFFSALLGISPTCGALYTRPADNYKPGCNVVQMASWTIGVGFVEETFKAIWLFHRLRRRTQDLPNKCCFWFPASHSYDCGCWFNLAPTPHHVLLCAIASGAGFGCIESMDYTLAASPEEYGLIWVASLRMITASLHIAWTTLVGAGLAAKMFLAESKRPSIVEVLLPSCLLHGLFDYSITSFAFFTGKDGNVLFGTLILFFGISTVLLSYRLMLRITGVRFFREGYDYEEDAPDLLCAPHYPMSEEGTEEDSD